MVDRSLTPNVISYNTMMSVMSKGKRLDLVHHYFQELKTSGIEINEITWTTAISAEKLSEDWKAAVRLLSEAKSSFAVF